MAATQQLKDVMRYAMIIGGIEQMMEAARNGNAVDNSHNFGTAQEFMIWINYVSPRYYYFPRIPVNNKVS